MRKKQKNKELLVNSMGRGQKKRKKKRKVLLLLLLPIFLLIGGLVVYGGSIIQQAANAISNANQDLDRGSRSKLREADVRPLTDNVSVLIVGIDTGEKRKEAFGDAVRSDALLFATFNITDKTVNIVSIPRDTRTYLPLANRTTKINHAYAFDGIDGSVAAVEELFGVPVDYFIEFNFDAFMEIVDSLDGIQVDVPITFTEQDSRDRAGAIHLEKGLQTLNGEQALALARTRHIDSDIQRGQRQQLIIEAIAQRALSLDSFTRIGDIIDAIDGNFRTNLTVNDMLAFYKYGTGAQINNLQLEGSDQWITSNGTIFTQPGNGGTYYFAPNKESVQNIHDILNAHLNNLPLPSDDSADDSTAENENDSVSDSTSQ